MMQPALRVNHMILSADFDHYGQRLAVCSADGVVRVFARGGSAASAAGGGAGGGGAPAQAQWRQHGDGFSPGSGAVWRVSWAHPEFGQVVAVCGAATTTSVYEEAEAPDAAGRVVSRWTRKAELGDARAQVNDCEFAPRHQGLRLATGSQDGLVRVYEAADVLNLTHFSLTDEFRGAIEGLVASDAGHAHANAHAAHGHPHGGGGGGGGAVTCLAWCTSQFDVPMMVVGGARGAVVVWAVGAASRKWARRFALRRHEGSRVNDVAWAPSVGRAHQLVASAGGGLLCLWRVQQLEHESDGAAAAEAEAEEADDWESGGGDGGDFEGDGGSGGGSGGGGGRAAAAATRDARASVVRLDGPVPTTAADAAAAAAAPAAGGTRHLETFEDGATVWRCEFNVLGTALASSGEDGMLRLRRADLAGRWAVAAELAVPESSAVEAVAAGGAAAGRAQELAAAAMAAAQAGGER